MTQALLVAILVVLIVIAIRVPDERPNYSRDLDGLKERLSIMTVRVGDLNTSLGELAAAVREADSSGLTNNWEPMPGASPLIPPGPDLFAYRPCEPLLYPGP